MSKRLIAFLSILSLFLSTPLIPVNAAVKAGAKCNKAGLTSIAAGKTYTCIKSGKKLIWNKGVLVKNLVTPEPPKIIETWWRAMLDSRSFSKVPKVIQSIDIKSAPNVATSETDKISAHFNDTLIYWSQFVVNPQPLFTTIVSEKDYEWYMTRWQELGSDNTGQYWWDKTGNGEGGAVGWNGKGQINMYFKVLTTKTSTLATREHIFHEVTHFFQATALKQELDNSPCWFGEGQAQFIQSAHSDRYESVAKSIAIQNRTWAKKAVNKYIGTTNLADGLFNALTNISRGDALCNRTEPLLGYTLGQLVNEKLVADFTWIKVINFMKKSSEIGWQLSFNATFGISAEDWYKKDLIPYLIDELKS
jgi:hypothetical protein